MLNNDKVHAEKADRQIKENDYQTGLKHETQPYEFPRGRISYVPIHL